MFVMNMRTYIYIYKHSSNIMCNIYIYYILYNVNKYNINTQISMHRELRQRDCKQITLRTSSPNFFAEQQHHQASGATNQLSRAHVLCGLSAIDGRPPHHGFLRKSDGDYQVHNPFAKSPSLNYREEVMVNTGSTQQ